MKNSYLVSYKTTISKIVLVDGIRNLEVMNFGKDKDSLDIETMLDDFYINYSDNDIHRSNEFKKESYLRSSNAYFATVYIGKYNDPFKVYNRVQENIAYTANDDDAQIKNCSFLHHSVENYSYFITTVHKTTRQNPIFVFEQKFADYIFRKSGLDIIIRNEPIVSRRALDEFLESKIKSLTFKTTVSYYNNDSLFSDEVSKKLVENSNLEFKFKAKRGDILEIPESTKRKMIGLAKEEKVFTLKPNYSDVKMEYKLRSDKNYREVSIYDLERTLTFYNITDVLTEPSNILYLLIQYTNEFSRGLFNETIDEEFNDDSKNNWPVNE